jgi:hypothetical protein
MSATSRYRRAPQAIFSQDPHVFGDGRPQAPRRKGGNWGRRPLESPWDVLRLSKLIGHTLATVQIPASKIPASSAG